MIHVEVNMATSAQRYNARMNRIFDKAFKKQQLGWDIEEKILEVANLFNEVTTSDLQGMASVKSHEIIEMFKKEILACGVTKPGNSLRAVECLQEKGLI
jgi:hypothetical protein